MKLRILTLTLAGLLCAGAVIHAELGYLAISVTDAGQTGYMSPSASSGSVCNAGSNTAYIRIFEDWETPAAATTASAALDAGACLDFGKSETVPSYYRAVTAICATGLTTTLRVYYD